MAVNLFRKKSLEKLTSPEQLDKLVVITSPTGWLALLALGIIIIVAFLWGIYGTIYYRTVGWGILINTEGISIVQSPEAGRVRSIEVEPGDFVRKGQFVARIDQIDLLSQIKNSMDRVSDLQEQLKKIQKLNKTEYKNKVHYLVEQENLTKNDIKDLAAHRDWLKNMLKGYTSLRATGVIAEIEFHKYKREYEDLLIKIGDEKSKLIDMRYEKQKLKSVIDKEHFMKQMEISDEQLKLDNLEVNYSEFSNVVSRYSGYVLELMTNRGELLNKFDPVISIVDERNKVLEAVVYFNAVEGKKVLPGMRVNVTPTVIKSEKFGSIEGIVTGVGKLPSSKKAIMAKMQNDVLVEMIVSQGVPFEATVKLIPDPNTISGYKWTSSKGPPIEIRSGTICTGSVITREEAPINLLFQLCKKYLLGIGEDEDRTESYLQKK